MTDKKKKLNQVVAVRKGVASRTIQEATEVYRVLKNAALFEGLSKTYHPNDAEGETLPDESKKVQYIAETQLKKLMDIETELYDIELTADLGNAGARADIIIDNKTVATGVPATTLIFLEKKVKEIRNTIQNLPELSTDKNWTFDPKSGLHKSDIRKSHRSKKIQKVVSLSKATVEHAENAVLVGEDVNVGIWETVDLSGAFDKPRKELLLKRINKLIDALEVSRELANMVEVNDMKVGESLFAYVLNG